MSVLYGYKLVTYIYTYTWFTYISVHIYDNNNRYKNITYIYTYT